MIDFLHQINTWLTAALMVVGAFLMLLAAIGILRLPDLPTRMHASTKAGVLGTSLIMLAVAFNFNELAVTARVIAVIVFLSLTAPVAAHVIGRAGYFVGTPLWDKTVKDELADYYELHHITTPDSHKLNEAFDTDPEPSPTSPNIKTG